MNHTAEESDVTVLITTYNRPAELRQLVTSLIANAGELTLHCRIYDDASEKDYAGLPNGSDRVKVSYVRMPSHCGKTGYWKLINRMFQDVRTTQSKYFIQLPDDVQVMPGFFDHAVGTYLSITDPKKIALNLYLDSSRIGRPCWTKTLPRICRFGEANVFKTGWIDMCYVAERRFFEELNYAINPIPKHRWNSNPKLSSGVGLQISKRLEGFSFYQIRECLLNFTGVPSLMHPHRPRHEDLSIVQLDPIICGVASVPERSENLRRTVESIVPFVDELHVYLNNYPVVPSFLKHPKISVYQSQDYGDWGDAGKFFAAGKKRGFYLTIDDDIVYPKDYVWTLVNEIRSNRKANRRIAVGFHGKVMRARVRHFYRDHVRQYHFIHALEKKTGVHILGTGTLAFHTDDLGITMADFKGPRNLADIYFGIACQKSNVGCIVLPHPEQYLIVQRIPPNRTIWGYYHSNDMIPTTLYNEWNNWRIQA